MYSSTSASDFYRYYFFYFSVNFCFLLLLLLLKRHPPRCPVQDSVRCRLHGNSGAPWVTTITIAAAAAATLAATIARNMRTSSSNSSNNNRTHDCSDRMTWPTIEHRAEMPASRRNVRFSAAAQPLIQTWIEARSKSKVASTPVLRLQVSCK